MKDTFVRIPHAEFAQRRARAGAAARDAGFDGVELHFAHAYTMAGFLSRTNDRDVP